MEIVSCVYWIINLVNGKIYIGSALYGINKRWNEHFCRLRKNKHPNKHLQRSWNEYGGDCFMVQELEKVEDANRLLEKEQYWLDNYQSYNRNIGYNICPKAGNTFGVKRKFSNIHRQNLSKSLKGRKFSKETIRKNSESHKGKKLSIETKQKISKIRIEKRLAKGENNSQSRLTLEQVREIRRKFIPRKYTIKMLAKEYNVSKRCIQKILYNQTWKEK